MRKIFALLAVLAAFLVIAPAAVADPTSLIRDALTVWSVKDTPTDAQYMAGGQWFQDSVAYPSKTQGGPATGAALMWRKTGDWKWYTMATQTIGWMLNNGQRADGAFAAPGDTGAAIPTQFFAQELGTTYVLLEAEPHFLPEQAAWWRSKMAKAADFLLNGGDAVWYANGNVNVGYISTFYFAWRMTGLQRFKDAYEREIGFTSNPTTANTQTNSFRGYGWQWGSPTSMPTDWPTCATGAGFFTENIATTQPGFDTEYTNVQADEMLRLFILTGDPRIKCMANELLNQIKPRINTTTWQLDTSGGSRHTEAVRTVPFLSSSLAVMSANGRDDLAGLGAAQWPTVDSEYRKTFTYSNVNFYKGLGDWLTLIPLDELVRSGVIARVP